jgi:hypothetical protein
MNDEFWNTILGGIPGGSSIDDLVYRPGQNPAGPPLDDFVYRLGQTGATGALAPPDASVPSIESWLATGLPPSVIAEYFSRPDSASAATSPSSGLAPSAPSLAGPGGPYDPVSPATSGANGLDFTGLASDDISKLLSHLQNAAASQSVAPSNPSTEAPDPALGQRAMDALNAELSRQEILGTIYPAFETALGAWSDAAQPIQQQYGAELDSKIYLTRDGWQIGPAYSSGSHTTVPIIQDGGIPGSIYWGYIHTHPDNVGMGFGDKESGRLHWEGGQRGGFAYLARPNGQIDGWAPNSDPNQPQGPLFVIRPPTRQ